MSSILTNASASVALETLRSINRNLGDVQSQISTGKKVSNAADNAAIFAISTVLETDVKSFEQISDSLNLGSSTVNVARSAAEQVTSILQEAKTLIVSAQEQNVDRTKIQPDLDELVNQIDSIVNAAQFNGLNLLKGGGAINILSSLDRAEDQSVTVSNIGVARADLQTSAATVGATATAAADAGFATVGGATIAAGASQTVTFDAGALAEGTSFSLTVGGTDTIEYVSRANDTLNDVARNIKSLVESANITGISVDVSNVADPTSTDTVLTFNNSNAADVSLAAVTTTGGTAGGGLSALSGIDVTTDVGAAAALANIEGLLQTAIGAASTFGSAQKRIGFQSEFVSTLTDSLKNGIGALTDANIEEASARLQSLQVQQQLGIQALSIANQQPQQLLALFR